MNTPAGIGTPHVDATLGDPDLAPILVVDDQAVEPRRDRCAALAERLPAGAGADRRCQALLALLEQDFAAIVLDIRMPEMSGLELADLIKARPRSRHVPILFLTAHLFNEHDILRGYSAGAVDYLTKPIHAEILRSKIAVFVELFRKTRELARANEALRREVFERERAEAALHRVNLDLEERVRERTQALERADRRKDEFLAVLGHELRGPLAPIIAAMDVLQQPAATDIDRAHSRGVIRRQVRQMTRLIDDLLDVGRITSDRLVLRPTTVALADILDAAIETSRPSIEERGHRLILETPPDPLALHVDAARLAQVLSNLLTNAAKYTAPGGDISVIVTSGNEGVTIRVRDSGVGIDPALLPTIFELFVQADHTAGFGGGGLGIGLALARQLVQMHGGRLEATSEGAGRGSEFTIWLPPACIAPAADLRVADVARDVDARPLRVLVVDDNDDSADMLAMMLGTWGHDARSAYDGMSALEVADAFRPEVVLLDLGLPGLDGHAIAARLREKPWAERVTLFAVTGRGQDEDRQRSRAAGFHEHLVKPVVPETLQSMLARISSSR